uniref:Uncharacterized protein n=1 Tax=Myotis myotis TaxID=51298 RepID=A0A7J7RLN1_MYOMY|nr:hypothetical protein mMyoMyo1_010285 [Myotis myotis]
MEKYPLMRINKINKQKVKANRYCRLTQGRESTAGGQRQALSASTLWWQQSATASPRQRLLASVREVPQGNGVGSGQPAGARRARGAALLGTYLSALAGHEECTRELKVQCAREQVCPGTRTLRICCVQGVLSACEHVLHAVGGWWGGPRLQRRAESSRRREIGLEQTHYGKQLPGRGSRPAGPAARRLEEAPWLQECLGV